jgi:hypothetical protein
VILLEKHYHKAIDVWSVGVVLADLFKYISKNEKCSIRSLKNNNSGQIFDSQRCFPLSPRNV